MLKVQTEIETLDDVERNRAAYLNEKVERLIAQLQVLAEQAQRVEKERVHAQAEANHYRDSLVEKYKLGPSDRVQLPEGHILRAPATPAAPELEPPAPDANGAASSSGPRRTSARTGNHRSSS